MIILPERNAPRGKVLLPQRPREWRAPSQRRAVYGIEDQTRWRLTARLHDGAIVWRGWFDDREDADAFLFAVVDGYLPYQRELWDIPTDTWMPGCGYGNVGWRPDLGEALSYDFAIQVFLTSPTGSNQTYTVPADWNNAANTIETIGGGGGGSAGSGSSYHGGGGAGGAYSKTTNLALSGTATYQIGVLGSAGTSGAAGGTGGDSWFNGTTLGGSSVGAKGAAGGTIGGGNWTVPGADSASGIGSTKYSGGGTTNNAGGGAGGGGGGAGGPNGIGAACGTTPGGNNNASGGGGSGGGTAGGNVMAGTTGTNGGNNFSGSGGGSGGVSAAGGPGSNGGGGGGAGSGANAGGAGGAGVEWDASHGAGGGAGGGGGSSGSGGGLGGTAGNYGGGGGGGGYFAGVNGGAGAQGIVAITYTPLVKASSGNMPMLGM